MIGLRDMRVSLEGDRDKCKGYGWRVIRVIGVRDMGVR